MPMMNPSDVPEEVNTYSIQEQGRYGGAIAEVMHTPGEYLYYTIQCKEGQQRVYVDLDENDRPTGRGIKMMSDLLRCTNIPSAEHWQADKVQPFEYAYEDLKFRKIQFRLKWGKPNERYPEAKLWLDEILPANSPLQGPLGPDGTPKPPSLVPAQAATPIGSTPEAPPAAGAVEFGSVPF